MRDHIPVTDQAFAPACQPCVEWDPRIRQCHDEHSSVHIVPVFTTLSRPLCSESYQRTRFDALVSWSSEVGAVAATEARSGCVAHNAKWHAAPSSGPIEAPDRK